MRLIGNFILGGVAAFVLAMLEYLVVALLSGSTTISNAWSVPLFLLFLLTWVLFTIEFQNGSPHLRRWLGRGGFVPSPTIQPDETPKPGAVDRIRQAKALLDEGALSQDEFDAIKQRAIRDV